MVGEQIERPCSAVEMGGEQTPSPVVAVALASSSSSAANARRKPTAGAVAPSARPPEAKGKQHSAPTGKEGNDKKRENDKNETDEKPKKVKVEEKQAQQKELKESTGRKASKNMVKSHGDGPKENRKKKRKKYRKEKPEKASERAPPAVADGEQSPFNYPS